MRLFLKKVIIIINLWRIIPSYILLKTLRKDLKHIVFDEMEHWKKCTKAVEQGLFLFGELLIEHREYRNLISYRIKSGGGIIDALKSVILKALFPIMDTLYIMCPTIGERLFIQHGFSTWISAKSIGSDCWINQQVTIGYTFDDEPPVIGNGVRISAGAKVVGMIEVGDNAIIAANAAVVKDVPENMIVGGVPAKIIGENKEHKLYNKSV